MSTIIGFRQFIKEKHLVVVPQKTYEDFLKWQRAVKSKREVKMTASEKRALIRGRKNIAQGKYVTLEQLRHELGIKD